MSPHGERQGVSPPSSAVSPNQLSADQFVDNEPEASAPGVRVVGK